MVTYACNHNYSQETEAKDSQIWRLPVLHDKFKGSLGNLLRPCPKVKIIKRLVMQLSGEATEITETIRFQENKLFAYFCSDFYEWYFKGEEKYQLAHCIINGILSVRLICKTLSRTWWAGILGNSRCQQNVAEWWILELGGKVHTDFKNWYLRPQRIIFKS